MYRGTIENKKHLFWPGGQHPIKLSYHKQHKTFMKTVNYVLSHHEPQFMIF